MAKAKKNKKEKTQDYSALLKRVRTAFDEAKSEQNQRVTHKTQGFDEYDNLYRSHIDSSKWPFNTKIFIPLAFKSIYGKDTRLITGKVKGKLVEGQYGNPLGARIGTELLSSQYDEHDEYFEEPLIAKFFRLSQNARKYGAGFGLVAWRKEVKNGEIVFDGPIFETLDNRKCYTQPGAVSISDSDYFHLEREITLEELETINEVSEANSGKPAYKNLDKLRGIKQNTVTDNYDSRNAALRGLDNKRSGSGKQTPFRVVTTYMRDRWITWLPDVGGDDEAGLGLVIRVTKNPYKHGLLPIIRLVYIPIDDDIYGVSELEPGRSSQKAVNALTSGFIEAVSTELYPIMKAHPTNVDWKTIEFKPRAAWIMNNPQTDMVRLEGAITFTRNFVEAYKLLNTTFNESMGDTAADSSNLAALATNKTATEIKDLALQRGSRDNLNKIFLSAAIQKIYSLWWSMDQQFLTDKKVIRVAGRDAIEHFIEEGLNGWELTNDGYGYIETIMNELTEQGYEVAFEEVYEFLRESGALDEYAKPLYPVNMAGEVLPKLNLNDDEKTGFLSVDRKDLTGQYRFVVDLNTLGVPNEQEEVQAMATFFAMAEKNKQDLQAQGYRLKSKESLELMADKLKIKNADQLFEAIEPEELAAQQGMGMPQMPGVQGPQPMQQQATPNQFLGGVGNVQQTI